MAGTTFVQKEASLPKDFKPDPKEDFSRSWAKKQKDWREAEAEVVGKNYVKAKEEAAKTELKLAAEAKLT